MKKIALLMLILGLGLAVTGCGERIRERLGGAKNETTVNEEQEEEIEGAAEESTGGGTNVSDTSELDQLLNEANDADNQTNEAMGELESINESGDEPLDL